jgi:type IV pilus assembly protein PilM
VRQLTPAAQHTMPPTLKSLVGRRSGGDVVGLDIQPGVVAAVKARVNGGIVVERAAVRPLPADAVREGEVIDRAALSEALRELFDHSGLGKRVRVGVANQRTVMRTLELPPMSDRKELAAAINFQAQDQVPMPLANAVLDFHPLGVIDTADGPRERVVLVAAQRDMIEALLDAVRTAGLQPEGVDLSAFALIRSLYRSEAAEGGRVLYLNVDGLTNLAIADGTVCRFTRVVGGGLEGMASEIAERRGIALTEARELLSAVDLGAQPEPPPAEAAADEAPAAGADDQPTGEGDAPVSDEEHEAREQEMSYEEMVAAPEAPEAPKQPTVDDSDVRTVLERGIHDIAGEVRNSLDFHRSQEGGGEVTRIVLSGSALDLPGFTEALQSHLRVSVEAQTVGLANSRLDGEVSTHRLAVAAGLAALEIQR